MVFMAALSFKELPLGQLHHTGPLQSGLYYMCEGQDNMWNRHLLRLSDEQMWKMKRYVLNVAHDTVFDLWLDCELLECEVVFAFLMKRLRSFMHHSTCLCLNLNSHYSKSCVFAVIC